MRVTQVSLRRYNNTWYQEEVCWIDSRLARSGATVRDEEGRHWQVFEAYGTRESADLEKEYKVWRRFREVLDGR